MKFNQIRDKQDREFDPPENAESALTILEREGWIEEVLVRLKRLGLSEQQLEVFPLKLVGYTLEDIEQKTGLKRGAVRAAHDAAKPIILSVLEEAEV